MDTSARDGCDKVIGGFGDAVKSGKRACPPELHLLVGRL